MHLAREMPPGTCLGFSGGSSNHRWGKRHFFTLSSQLPLNQRLHGRAAKRVEPRATAAADPAAALCAKRVLFSKGAGAEKPHDSQAGVPGVAAAAVLLDALVELPALAHPAQQVAKRAGVLARDILGWENAPLVLKRVQSSGRGRCLLNCHMMSTAKQASIHASAAYS